MTITVKEKKKNKKSGNGNGWEYEVFVSDNGGETIHNVTMDKAYYDGLTDMPKEMPEDFIRRSFEFLLAREPKESILKNFNIKEINKYFPEFEKEMCYYC